MTYAEQEAAVPRLVAERDQLKAQNGLLTTTIRSLQVERDAARDEAACLRVKVKNLEALAADRAKERDELQSGIQTLLDHQRKDLADVERFRGMARKYMDERDDLRAALEAKK